MKYIQFFHLIRLIYLRRVLDEEIFLQNFEIKQHSSLICIHRLSENVHNFERNDDVRKLIEFHHLSSWLNSLK